MLGKQLRSARKAAGRKQREVAEHLGITEGAYCAYETGKRRPTPEAISKIATFLGVSGDYLLETGTRATAAADKLLALYKSLDREDQRQLVQFANHLMSSDKYNRVKAGSQRGQKKKTRSATENV